MPQTLNAAYYADVRARAQQRARQDPSLIPHATPQGYSYWGCRCDDCTEANTQRRRRQRDAARGKRAS
jgi:hypothetical protein